MKDYNSKGFQPIGQLGVLIGLLGAGMLLSSMASIGIWSAMTHRPIMTMQADMADPKYYSALMLMQAVSTVLIMLAPAWLCAKICYKNSSEFLGMDIWGSARQFVLLIAILFLAFILNGALGELNELIPIPASWEQKFKAMEESRKEMEAVFVNIDSLAKYIASMGVVAVLAAIVEEFFFRGALQNILMRWFKSPVAAILVTGFIFSVIHLSYYGFLVRFALGVILGFIYFYSGSIWQAVFFHFLFNGLQVTALYIAGGEKDLDSMGLSDYVSSGMVIPVILVVLVLVGVGLFALFKQYKSESDKVLNTFKYIEPDPNDISDWIANNEE